MPAKQQDMEVRSSKRLRACTESVELAANSQNDEEKVVATDLTDDAMGKLSKRVVKDLLKSLGIKPTHSLDDQNVSEQDEIEPEQNDSDTTTVKNVSNQGLDYTCVDLGTNSNDSGHSDDPISDGLLFENENANNRLMRESNENHDNNALSALRRLLLKSAPTNVNHSDNQMSQNPRYKAAFGGRPSTDMNSCVNQQGSDLIPLLKQNTITPNNVIQNVEPVAGPSHAPVSAPVVNNPVLPNLFGSLGSITSEGLNELLLRLLGKNDTYECVANDIDQGIPDRVRAEIWANRYVDFVQLLKADSARNEPDLFKSTKHKNEKMHSFMGWSKAYHIFQTIYVQKYPEQNIDLIKYEETVRDLYHKMPNTNAWREYDEKFRFRRQSTLAPWSQRDMELWQNVTIYATKIGPRNPSNNSQNTSSSGSFRNSSSNQGSTQSSNYFNGQQNKPNYGSKIQAIFQTCKQKQCCFRFQNSTCDRENCRYKHKCYLCSGDHNGSSCSQNKSAGKFNKNSNSN